MAKKNITENNESPIINNVKYERIPLNNDDDKAYKQEIIDLLNSILTSLKTLERNTFKGY